MTSAPGFVVGLDAEARIAARSGWPVAVGGGTPEGAVEAVSRLIGQGVTGVISFGLAGGLDPALRPGTVIVPRHVLVRGVAYATDARLASVFGGLTDHVLLAGSVVAVTAEAKAALFGATGAQAIDLESGAVAQHCESAGVAFAVVRSICDPAERDLPEAALLAVGSTGHLRIGRLLGSLLRDPGQIRRLIRLARDATLARRSLINAVDNRVSCQTDSPDGVPSGPGRRTRR